jgi:hypothetical protein
MLSEYDFNYWIDQIASALDEFDNKDIDDDDAQYSYIVVGELGYKQHPIPGFRTLQELADAFSTSVFQSHSK